MQTVDHALFVFPELPTHSMTPKKLEALSAVARIGDADTADVFPLEGGQGHVPSYNANKRSPLT